MNENLGSREYAVIEKDGNYKAMNMGNVEYLEHLDSGWQLVENGKRKYCLDLLHELESSKPE